MAKTRCFSCGQLGHMSRECPNRRDEPASNFFVCQDSSGIQNKTYVTTLNYVNISESKEQKLAVYAGVQTGGHEAVVDTAAEEAVIGSTANDAFEGTACALWIAACAGAWVNSDLRWTWRKCQDCRSFRHSSWRCKDEWIVEGV